MRSRDSDENGCLAFFISWSKILLYMQDIDDCPSEADSQKDVIQTIAVKHFLSCLISSHPPTKPFDPAVMGITGILCDVWLKPACGRI